MVCKTCRDVLLRSDAEGPGPDEQLTPLMKWGPLQKNALRGCTSCQIICSTILAGTPPQSAIQSVDVWLDESSVCINVSYLQSGSVINALERLYPFAQERTPWPTIATSAYTSFVAPELEAATELIRTWLKVCDESHGCFNITSDQATALPTRVLDVGSDDHSPRLHVSRGQHGQYAALSHCWGSRSPNIRRMNTTSKNLEAFQGSVDYEALPATFRDAVDICRSLEIQYLWIDSLCILQDSELDWHKESGRMRDVYQNAYLTLAADLGPHSDFGLFSKDAQARIPIREFTQDHSNGSTHQIYIRRNWPVPGRESTDSRSCYASEASSCLNTRGWVLQERLLSARTVHFTSSELQWECSKSYVCSCGIPVEKRSPKTFFDTALSSSAQGEPQNLALVPELWHAVVKNYSLRRLTYAEDRLAAISGVAAAMPHPPQDYCAGLWKQTILYDLTFFNPFGHETWKEVAGDRTRASKYSVEYPSARTEDQPSWSWTSITGPVKFGARSREDFTLEWQLEDVNCTPSTANPFGPVDPNSSLHMTGYLLPVTIEERHSPVAHEEFQGTILHTSIEMCVVREDKLYPGRNKTWFDVDLDGCEWQDISDKYYVLVAGTQTADDIPLALILRAQTAHDGGLKDAAERNSSAATNCLVHEQDAIVPKRARSGSPSSASRGAVKSLHRTEGLERTMKRVKTGASEVGQRTFGSSSTKCEDALAYANSTATVADDEPFMRIGLVRLDNWRGCEWRSKISRRSVRII